MNESFRRRVFTPIVMPVTIVGLILLFGISVSRVLLAVPESMSVIVATVLAAYVLLMAFVVERNRGIAAPALAVGLVVGLLGVTGAGALAASAGIREIHHEEEGGHGGEGGEGEGEAPAEVPADAVVWVTDSTNIEYTDAPTSFPAGEVTIAIDNPTGVPHNVVLEGFEGDAPLVEATGGIDVATVDVPAGTYTYFCSVTGHRAAGMEGEVTVE